MEVLNGDDMKNVWGGSPVSGYSVGVITLKTDHALMPGNVQHAQSFPQPVLYQDVDLEDPWPLIRGEERVTDKVIAAAQILQKKGVSIVVGACGSFAYYQRAVKEALEIPVFLSIMLQVPLLQAGLSPKSELGIICASSASMNDRLFSACNITETDSLVIKEMRGNPAFDHYMDSGSPIDWTAIEAEVLQTALSMTNDHPAITSFVLQCSELPPVAPLIQQNTGRPVFDMTLFIRWLQQAADYQPYTGMIRTQPNKF